MANPWTSFLSLLPNDQRFIGRVIDFADGKATVDLPPFTGTRKIKVNASQVGFGAYIFIEGNTMVSQAPDIREVAKEIIK